MFNVIQENVIRGGQRGQVVTANGARRRASVREMTDLERFPADLSREGIHTDALI